MKRALVLALLLIAAPVHAQRFSGSGLIKPPSQRLSLVPSDQFITTSYYFDSVPAGTAAGWYVTQTTAAGVPLTAHTPFLLLEAKTDSRWARVWEDGFNSGPSEWDRLYYEQTDAFGIANLGAIASGANNWVQVNFGDTCTYKAIGTMPTKAMYGIIVTGTAAGSSGYAPNGKVTAFVCNGADSTFIALTGVSTASGYNKFWIHNAGGGAGVEFWVDGVLQTTITSPSIGNAIISQTGCSIIVGGDTSQDATVVFGPLVIQRRWP